MRNNFFKVLNDNQKGQALLFVVVAMTVALTVGVSVSQRALSSLRRTSNVDTASRVYAASEGGIEWFLRQPMSKLEELSDGNNSSGAECPTGTSDFSGDNDSCILSYAPPAQSNDKITAIAKINVKTFSFNYTGGGNDHYWFNVEPGDVKEVKLYNFKTNTYYRGNLDICWKSLESANSSGLYYLTYAKDGIKAKSIISPRTVIGTYKVTQTPAVVANAGKLDYVDCYTINISTDLVGLRIKSLYAPSKVGVFPAAASFPTQGYAITSVGSLNNTTSLTKESKTIITYRSFPYAPSIFDYALYSVNDIK